MRIDVVDERWRTLRSQRTSRINLDPEFTILDETHNVKIIMGSGPFCTLSDAMSCVMTGFASPDDYFLSFDPEYEFRYPTKTLVSQEKLQQYKSRFTLLPKISAYPDGFYPETALEIYQRVNTPLNVFTVCPEDGLDYVKENFRELTSLVRKGIINQISIYDPSKFKRPYLTKSKYINLTPKPIKVTASTPESLLFNGHKKIWLTEISKRK